MNVARYEFSKENTNYLLEFLKEANVNKSNRFCDHDKYRIFKKLCPLKEDTKKLLKIFISEQNSVIDITASDEEYLEEKVNNEGISSFLCEEIEPSLRNINQSAIEDVTYAIKENLDTQKCLTPAIINHLHTCNVDLEGIFSSLSEELNVEEVVNFGKSLKSAIINNELIIGFYIKHLLLYKINIEFSEELEHILNELVLKYPEILNEEISKYLLNSQKMSKVFSQFLEGLSNEFKTKLLHNFLDSYSSFQENHMELINILLNNQMDFDLLKKLIEIVSFVADNYCSDKDFGKLLINIMKCSGKSINLLEQPLKHIIGSHKSVWKSKIQKTFEECLQDSLSLSQSFM